MRVYEPIELIKILEQRNKTQLFSLSYSVIHDVDLYGRNLTNIDFSHSNFRHVCLTGADFSDSCIRGCLFEDCQMQRIRFIRADMREAALRYNDLSGSDISGANLYAAALEYAVLNDIRSNEQTRWWRMVPPASGAFIAWKCCTELRVVQLLVPADAKRVSATQETCRCSKAKVLSIRSIDGMVSYDWAQSTVDSDFYYEVGKWAIPTNGFEDDRWKDSSRGIHFFMERQQCINYQTR